MALHLSARRLRDGARPDQHHLVHGDLVLVRHRLADGADEILVRHLVAKRALDLLHHDQLLAAALLADGEGGAAVAAQRRMAVLHRVLDVLRIVVHAADDDDVLDAAGDVELAVLVEEAEVAGAQPRRVALAGDAGAERRFRRRRIVPVAQRHVRAGDPHLAATWASAGASGGSALPCSRASRLTVRVTGPCPRRPAVTISVASARPY